MKPSAVAGCLAALCACILFSGTQPLRAQAYPSQDIHFISAFPPGSGADVLVRYFAEKIRALANRTVVVENKAGANGNIAIEYVARSKPDGYTIFVHSGGAIAGNMHLFKKPPVDVGKALQMAATINRQAFMLTVSASSPYQTVAELTKAMQAKGNKATYASSSVASRVTGAMYAADAKLSALEVQYRSGPDTLNDMESGAVDYAFHDPVLALSQRREGRVRVLAICSDQRMASADDIPTMTELGYPGVRLVGWFSASVPAGTPEPIVNTINEWFNQVLSTEETAAFLKKSGGDPFISTPAAAQAFFLGEIEKYGDYVRIAHIEAQ